MGNGSAAHEGRSVSVRIIDARISHAARRCAALCRKHGPDDPRTESAQERLDELELRREAILTRALENRDRKREQENLKMLRQR